MKRRDFLKTAIATTVGVGLSTVCAEETVIGEVNINQVIDSFPWNTPPQMINGEYIDTQGTLPLRILLSNAILHPSSAVFQGESIWNERNKYWNCVRATKICIPTSELQCLYFNSSIIASATLKHDRSLYGGNGKVLEEIGSGIACPAAHLLRVTRDSFDAEWTMLTITAVYPR
jgi:hypothetical protein